MICTWLPLIGVVLFLGILCWRSWWQRRRYGSRGVLLFKSRRWQEKLRAALGVALVLVLVGQAVMVAVRPKSLAPVNTTDHLAAAIGHVTGSVLLFGGIALPWWPTQPRGFVADRNRGRRQSGLGDDRVLPLLP